MFKIWKPFSVSVWIGLMLNELGFCIPPKTTCGDRLRSCALRRRSMSGQPLGRTYSSSLREDASERRCMCVANGGCNELERFSFSQKCLGDADPPICGVVEWGHTHPISEMRSEACARHAREMSKLFKR